MTPSPLPVLVVDDHRDTADSTVVVLGSHGFDARPAYSCAGAVQAVGDFKPSVVVLDLRLSDGTGYGLAVQLERVLGYRPAFVVMTGVGGLEGHSRGVGIGRHLVKPVAPAILVDAIRQSLPRSDDVSLTPQPNAAPGSQPV